jgi:hypothetical protein
VTRPDETAETGLIPLSLNQEFVCLFDQGADRGPFGPRYHLVHAWRLDGPFDVEVLRGALDDLVERHEALRTLIATAEDGTRHQEILPPSSPELDVRDFTGVDPAQRDTTVLRLLDEVEASALPASAVPHLRAVVGRFDDRDGVLVVLTHHTATDGFSMRLVIRDLARFYAARKDGTRPDLPPVKQYREYARWQRAAGTDEAREYWRTALDGAEVFTVPTDRPRSAEAGVQTAAYRFFFEDSVIAPVTTVAKSLRCTPFIVLMAAFKLLHWQRTGETDSTMPTFTPGRGQDADGFADMVGPCFNFLPVRTELAGCATFRDVVARTRGACLRGYANDIPALQIFGQAPGLMAPATAPDRAPWVFQIFPFPFVIDGEEIGGVAYTEVRVRLDAQDVSSDVPDGALWTLNLDPAGGLVGSVHYKSALYDADTIAGYVRQYHDLLRSVAADPDAPLRLG